MDNCLTSLNICLKTNNTMKDKNGFINETQSGTRMILGFILPIPTLFMSMLFFYEYFFEHYYWHNRFRLWKLLKQNRVEIISTRVLKTHKRITEYIVKIDDLEYCIWVYTNRNRMTFGTRDNIFKDYIGLFISSPIMSYINNRIITRLRMMNENV